MITVLKRLRLLLAALVLSAMCLLFIDVSGFAAHRLAFLAGWQFVPAILAGSLVTAAAIIAVTLIAGRLYCSVLCPMGLLQDALSWIRSGRRYHHSPARNILRACVLAVFIAAFILGLPVVFGLIEPYSAFGRMAAALLSPLWELGNNVLAWWSEHADNTAFTAVDIHLRGTAALAAAAVTFTGLLVLTWKNGRIWCGICPVGTVLGQIARFSFFRARLEKSRCLHCRRCEHACPAGCIDAAQGTVDTTRCIACLKCSDVCNTGALVYGHTPASPLPAGTKPKAASKTAAAQAVQVGSTVANPGRRAFLSGLGTSILAGTAPDDAMAATGTPETDHLPGRRRRIPRESPVTPPGSWSRQHLLSRCTGCQLCVAACPSGVLFSTDRGKGMLQPEMSFEYGYCRTGCSACSNICPTGAIEPVTPATKSSIQIGRAIVDAARCIITTDGVDCQSCVRSCPPQVVSLVPGKEPGKDGKIRKRPVVDTERCIGCGACELFCPARPIAAIRVEGNESHRRI